MQPAGVLTETNEHLNITSYHSIFVYAGLSNGEIKSKEHYYKRHRSLKDKKPSLWRHDDLSSATYSFSEMGLCSAANISANHRNVPQTVDICTKRGRSHSQYVPPFTSGGGRIVEALFQANMDANTHLDIIKDAFFTGSQTISFCIMATKTGILSNIMISS